MRTASRNKLIASGALLACLAVSAALSGTIASSVGRYELGYANTATESDPPEVAAGIAMGAFRGLFVNFLWIRANNLKQEGKFHESVELARAITKLQPRFPRVWAFHAWNLSYNISVATQTPEERYDWVKAGVDLLRQEGIPANPNDLTLHRELAWIFLHKIQGYTDDSNQYYKRRVAAEWTEVLGLPPRPTGGNTDRDAITALYSAWLQQIIDAPDTLEQLTESDERVAQLVDELKERVGVGADREMLRRYALHVAVKSSVKGPAMAAQFGPRSTAMSELVADPQYESAWPQLLAHARKRVLRTEYGMSPVLMQRYTEKFGPLDWRHPASHAVYWSHRGVERALTRFTDENEKNFDFVNADRITMQAIQEIWRSGDLYFNYFEFVSGGRGFYQGVPNPYFVESYGRMAGEIEDRGGIFESDQRVHRSYAAGYENFLIDAAIFFYRRGQRERAEYWYREYRTFDNQNMHDTERQIQFRTMTLEDFVAYNLKDRLASPSVAVQEVYGNLQGAYASLLRGERDYFENQFEYAKRQHRYFMTQQYREVVAAGDVAQRMEFMDRDFRVVAGLSFVNTLSVLPFADAQLMYTYAPDDLKRFAYDGMFQRFKGTVDELAARGGDTFEVLFPEPPEMEPFRAWLAQREADRSERRLDHINRQ
jgi:hypothetical protein